MEEPQLQGHANFRLCDHVTNEKNIYLTFHNIYGHQSLQSGNLRLEEPTH